jgi:DNA polymerase
MTRAHAVTKLVEHLQHLREEGQRTIDVRPESLQALTTNPAAAALAAIAGRIAKCRKCRLCEKRRRTVPGQGSPETEILFVGEGPGEDEDLQGLAFVGRAGQLLTRLIGRMGFSREQVFIANIVKCRPPGNRKPEPDEMAACLPYLHEQIDILRPRVIVALGGTAVQGLVGEQKLGITRLRGQWMEFRGVPLMPTYHPSYLLRGGGDEKARYWEVWEDMLEVLRRIGREPPARPEA